METFRDDGSARRKRISRRVTVTLDPILYDWLKVAAAEERRSLSGQIRYELDKLVKSKRLGT